MAPIVREADGLALSSRNVYLSGVERERARALSRALRTAQERYRTGERAPEVLTQAARAVLEAAEGVALQYVELVTPDTLETPLRAEAGHVLAIAALVGKTRLIDNVVIGAA